MPVKYEFSGCAKVCRDGFTITRTWQGDMCNMKEIIPNTKLIIHVPSNENYFVEYNSENGFTVRKIFELINQTWLNYTDKYCNGNDDIFSDMDIHGFKLKDCDVHTIYST